MRHQFIRRVTAVLLLFLSISLCSGEASAQRKRNKRSRRVTNPVTVNRPVLPPATSTQADPQIISTANDQQAGDQAGTSDTSGQPQNSSRRGARSRAVPQVEGDEDTMRRTVN